MVRSFAVIVATFLMQGCGAEVSLTSEEEGTLVSGDVSLAIHGQLGSCHLVNLSAVDYGSHWVIDDEFALQLVLRFQQDQWGDADTLRNVAPDAVLILANEFNTRALDPSGGKLSFRIGPAEQRLMSGELRFIAPSLGAFDLALSDVVVEDGLLEHEWFEDLARFAPEVVTRWESTCGPLP